MQYGAMQNMQPQYGARSMQPQNAAMMGPQYGGMQPGAQPMRPNAPSLNSQFRMTVEPNTPESAVMPMQGLKQAMMQMLMRRK